MAKPRSTTHEQLQPDRRPRCPVCGEQLLAAKRDNPHARYPCVQRTCSRCGHAECDEPPAATPPPQS